MFWSTKVWVHKTYKKILLAILFHKICIILQKPLQTLTLILLISVSELKITSVSSEPNQATNPPEDKSFNLLHVCHSTPIKGRVHIHLQWWQIEQHVEQIGEQQSWRETAATLCLQKDASQTISRVEEQGGPRGIQSSSSTSALPHFWPRCHCNTRVECRQHPGPEAQDQARSGSAQQFACPKS